LPQLTSTILFHIILEIIEGEIMFQVSFLHRQECGRVEDPLSQFLLMMDLKKHRSENYYI
jgi:hypothetical protein